MRAEVRGWVRSHVSPELWWRAQKARALVAARRRGDSPLTEQLGVGRCGDVVIRPLSREDGPAWTASMRANAQRMTPWWNLAADEIDRQTDESAFEDHLQTWDYRRRRGQGVCLAIVGPDGLFGELQVWHLHPGALTCEIGLWMAPVDPRLTKAAGGAFGYAFDRLFGDVGVRRIDAPVAAENTLPRAFLRAGGFKIDASIPQWRELHGELADYDLFGLTAERWMAARGTGRRLIGEWQPDRPPELPDLSRPSSVPAAEPRIDSADRSA